MKRILESKYGLLIFSLASGVSYFVLIMMLISNVPYSYLLGIFFFPTVICGAALCLFKTIKNMQENDEYRKIRYLIVIHICVIILAVLFMSALIISKFI